MKLRFTFWLTVLFMVAFSGISRSQDLVYSQDHGIAFNRGTINTDVLMQIIQQKQDELNKFVVSRLVTGAWNDKDKEGDTNSRLDNFTTRYLVYETLSELTVTADKSQFGQQTLELLKEAATIFGLAVAVNEKYNGNYRDLELKLRMKRFNPQQFAIDASKMTDTIGFNRTLDMVLNICITNPQISGYFPVYGKLADPDNEDRVWYETDSRYYALRNDSTVAAFYNTVKMEVDRIWQLASTVKQTAVAWKAGEIDSLLDVKAKALLDYIVSDTSIMATLERNLKRIESSASQIQALKSAAHQLYENKQLFTAAYLEQIRKFRYEFDAVKGSFKRNDNYNADKLKPFMEMLTKATDASDRKLRKRSAEFVRYLQDKSANGGTVPKSEIATWLRNTSSEKSEWAAVLMQNAQFAGYLSDAASLTDRTLNVLEKLGERAQMVQALYTNLVLSSQSGPMGSFTFNEQELESAKKLMNELIDYIDKTGKYNTAAVYLHSLIDNISYRPADSVARKPATVSLNFESVIYTLDDKLVTPARLERTRYFEPYINIGVNYAGFLYANTLQNGGSTNTSLSGMTFASEKIGIKYKLVNHRYTRSFKPGVVYRYYGRDWSWKRPQPVGVFDDVFIDFHTGGLLYNVVNLTTEKSFNFPFAGVGFGVRTFNGLTLSGSLNLPYTGKAFRNENLFVMCSIDIPIIDYIRALRD